jgi:hypothetical protein
MSHAVPATSHAQLNAIMMAIRNFSQHEWLKRLTPAPSRFVESPAVFRVEVLLGGSENIDRRSKCMVEMQIGQISTKSH